MARSKREHTHAGVAGTAGLPDEAQDAIRRKWFDAGAVVLMFALGAWLSFNYFGHKLVPSSDFPSFVTISRQMLSGHAPVTFKRAPIHGALVAGISRFTQSSQHPDLTAGWILNAVLYPFIGVLLYLIARRFLGTLPAALFAVIATVNPWTLYMLRDPICEIDLLFFFLLAFYLMAIRSRWCYLVASIGSMVRYEAAGIIVCAFLVDVLSTRDRKEWLKSLACAAGASIPLVIWMTATFVRGLTPGDTHYLSELGEPSKGKIVLGKFIDLLWQVAYMPIAMPPAYVKSFFVRPSAADAQALSGTFTLLQFAAGLTFLCGTVYALIKRNWLILAMVLFLFMYLMAHAMHAFAFHRFLTAVYWIALLVSCLGLQALWHAANRVGRVPRPVVAVAQLVLLATLFIWAGRLMGYLSGISEASVRSVPVLRMAIIVAVTYLILRAALWKGKAVWTGLVTLAVAAAILLSNQFSIATVIGNGTEDDEFRQVDQWYIQNARPGEKLACSMFMVLAMIDEKNISNFVPLPVPVPVIKTRGEPQKFLELCYKRDITYVVWDSRLGLRPDDRYWWMNGLNYVTMLSEPRSIGPYEFVKALKSDYTGRYVHIFRLSKPQPSAPPAAH